jgi:hypothetical protein
MALEGTLQLFSLPEVFKMVGAQRKTGILTVQGEHDIIAVSFLQGEVVAADALNQTVEDGLGQILLRQGLVSAERFSALSAEHQSGTQRLVDLLVQRGVLDRGQLLDALRLQTFQLLVQVLGWKTGEFKFYGGDEVSYEEGFVPLTVEEVLLRVAAESGARVPEPGDVLARTHAADTQLGSGAGLRYPEGMGPLSAEEEGVVGLFDGRRSLEELAQLTGLGGFKIRYAAYRLEQGGLVGRAGGRGAAAAPAPAEARSALEATGPVLLEPVAPPAVRIDAGADTLLVRGLSWLGLGVAALAALVVARAPSPQLALPFPWLASQRGLLVDVQRDAQYARIDRAARTFFLVDGRYPEGFEAMVERGLLAPGDARDPAGLPLRWLAEDVHYSVVPIDTQGRGDEEKGLAEAITGDFLLDPEFVAKPDGSDQVPLVLLD